ncbi:MAG: GNAT family N-acetyltransferase [Methylobacteriaceae bacterium]|nr:GNAT family N-acetyltransferase [Methylobacteriaceae bacterium]
MTLAAPAPIGPAHDLAGFDCGDVSLNDWLARRALANQASGATRTYVVAEDGRVVAYYALASGALACAVATGRVRRNMPDPIPVAILARLAIDRSWQGRGLGRALVRDAALRVLAAAEAIGVRGLVVHAISDEAAAFYRALGLAPAPSDPRLLMATLAELQAAL